ncbi:hypothetical protein B4168_1784 [Anoxybacillus flavithermus]|nr:hypothetical protein B4168_1784 [Anoxybacillus flavithermus]OAO84737.1 hypothetical protein GT23_3342 [Parageobacillus thermoglucosidasius]
MDFLRFYGVGVWAERSTNKYNNVISVFAVSPISFHFSFFFQNHCLQ